MKLEEEKLAAGHVIVHRRSIAGRIATGIPVTCARFPSISVKMPSARLSSISSTAKTTARYALEKYRHLHAMGKVGTITRGYQQFWTDVF